MSITLITITRNNAEALRLTLDSVAMQTVRPFRHIIVDGQSTDHTAQVIAEHAPAADVLSLPPHGVYDALNVGIAQVTSGIVGMLHAGDRFATPHVLQAVENTFSNSDRPPHFIFGDVRFVRNNGTVSRVVNAAEYHPKQLRYGMAPPHPTLYMTAEVARLMGPYATDLRVAADYEMFVRLFSRRDLRWQHVPDVRVDMQPGGLSGKWSNRLFVNNRERLRVMRRNNLPAQPWLFALNYYHIIKNQLFAH